jgi:hypothetical protein
MLPEVNPCERTDEGSGSGLLYYSRNISQGAYVSGEIKGIIPEVTGKPINPQPQGQGFGVKAPRVTDVMPEVGRSMPGQGEAGRKPRGGPIPF